MLTKDFVSCVHVRFYFFTAAHFHLARQYHFSFSHRRYEIFMFFFPRNSSPLFSVTRSSSFSVIHVSVNIKNNVEKDTTLLLFFLSKSPGGHAISYQMKPWAAFGLPHLLIELFYIGVPVVRTDGRKYGHVTTKISRMHRLPIPNFLTRGARAIKVIEYKVV